MPAWLQVVATLNPLSYAIEPIRYIYTHGDWSLTSVVMQAPFGAISMVAALAVLVVFDAIALLAVRSTLKRTLS
jgi:ABC-2 type transport system permease protein